MSIDRSFDHTNWLTPPHNRRAFQRVRELVPTAVIEAGDSPSVLPTDPLPLGRIEVRSSSIRTSPGSGPRGWPSRHETTSRPT